MEEEDKEPPKDEEDEDMEKSLLKALIEEIKGLRSDLAKAAKMEYEDDDEDEEEKKSKSKAKASKEEDGEDDEDEEKKSKAKKSEDLTVEKAVEYLEAQGYKIPEIEHGSTPRLEGGGQPLAKADDKTFDKIRKSSFPALYAEGGV